MGKIFGIIVVATWFGTLNAQVTVNDSVKTALENREMTFYSLQSGQKTVVRNDDWHLAVSVRPSQFPSNTLQGTSLRINEAFGVKVYQVPGFTADSFYNVIDTAGYRTWLHLSDSDSLLDLGALNNGVNIASYNYGWGNYSGAPNHDVVGKKIFLFELPGGKLKKFMIEQLDRDTAWDFRYANIDNSDLQTLHISKYAFSGKNFVYVDLVNKSVLDKEPRSSNWDLQFLKYAATDIVPGKIRNEVGVWQNKGTAVAKREGVDVTDPSYYSLPFSADMNAIGWNWKVYYYNQLSLSGKDDIYQGSYYATRDSLAYFVRTASGRLFKLVLTGYEGSTTGVIHFNTEEIYNTTGVPESALNSVSRLYPNPANAELYLELNATPAEIFICDNSGRLVERISASEGSLKINTTSFPAGHYLLGVFTESGKYFKRIVIEH